MTCLIVDDEIQSRHALKEDILDLKKGYSIIGEADGVQTAVAAIRSLKPDIVLLDIELADGTGFDVVEAVSDCNTKFIFITAYNQYAVKAFRVAAVDYLLKPVNGKHLLEALQKAIPSHEERLEIVKDKYRQLNTTNQRIAFASTEGYSLHFINDIIRCESDNNYCYIHFSNQDRILVSKTLPELEELLLPHGFERIHQSHLVNIGHVKKYLNKDNGYLLMSNDSKVPVAQRKKAYLLSLLQQYAV